MKTSLRRVFSLLLLTSVLSLSVEPETQHGDGIRIVRKRIKVPNDRDEELPREGRHLG